MEEMVWETFQNKSAPSTAVCGLSDVKFALENV
jgi:hypothetical protein